METVNNFLIWLGWNVDNTFYPPAVAKAFWSSPLGLFCTGAIMLTSAARLLHWRKSPDFFDTVWQVLFGTVAAAGFFVGLNGAVPHHLVKSLLILVAVRGIYKAWRLHYAKS